MVNTKKYYADYRGYSHEMERKALLHSGITMDTNKNHTSYSEDFIQAFKNRISSHMNVPEKCEVNPESLSKKI